jgi:hypothetical protein
MKWGKSFYIARFPWGEIYYIAIFPGGKMARGKGYYTTPVFPSSMTDKITARNDIRYFNELSNNMDSLPILMSLNFVKISTGN